jgi:Asp-tRNA(Asn)/Glu-tRNA(Gln) amidotransferase A subunit family amidase
MTITNRCSWRQAVVLAATGWVALAQTPGSAQLRSAQPGQFQVEEASIFGIQSAIRSGTTTCRGVVQAYIDRARAYNGACTALVTKDGAPVASATGPIRAGSPLRYPTKTVPISSLVSNYDQYVGTPLEFGRMEATASDPSVQEQVGMRVGIPNAGQLNALETLNIRGERSVTCKGDFDRAPSAGPLPPGAPAVCDEFRQQPDALERAAELDRQYGTNPDLTTLPMYCVAFSLKNWYDAKDMRSTGGNDVNFAMDVPKSDSPDIAELRSKGAIILAVATANNVGGASSSAGPAKPARISIDNTLQYGLWGGQACNPYDTARVPRGTSNGSGVSVAANLATCSICEQSSASCKGPASRNNIVNFLTTKGIMMDGGITSKGAGDRAGIHCKTVEDAALVLDAIKGYEPADMYTAIPKALIPKEPYASVVVKDGAARSLQGMRIGIVREFMVKHTKNDEAISDQLDKEIKAVLRDKLGAELVESVDPLYADDPSVPNMKYTFQDAFAEILPQTAPEYFWQKTRAGELEFAVPGWDVTSVDYAVALALHQAPLSPGINLRRISAALGNPRSPFFINKYLRERGDTRIKDYKAWAANMKFKSEQERAGIENALSDQDPRADPGSISYLKMQSVVRMVVLKVMYENKIDAFVNPEHTLPPPLLGGAGEPAINHRQTHSCCAAFTALLGSPEIDVPAGYVRTVYNPQFVLSADKKDIRIVTGSVESKLEHPMPLSLMFWGGPGSDADLVKVASAYEAATHHRVPPPAFGPLSAQGRTARRK